MRTILAAALRHLLSGAASPADRVVTRLGRSKGAASDGVRSFKGIPFAAPPVGALRWQPPQPPTKWTEVRPATAFGAQCMQRRQFADMVFRSSGTSEDCLFLNVWTPAKTGSERLPVLVYFYGGGFTAGDGSEPRYDGAAMARKRHRRAHRQLSPWRLRLLAHPELTKESPHHASGNYGLLDQAAALQWVRDNIAAFGGDPRKVTIAGESAGSISVSALMASPLSKGLIAGAIGESGAAINPTFSPVPLAEAEQPARRSAALKADVARRARAMPAADCSRRRETGNAALPLHVDGYFLPKTAAEIFAAGEQAHVPLLAGWNSQESGAHAASWRSNEPTPEGYAKAVKALFPDDADEALKLYPGGTADEVTQSATALASDRFIAFSTWKWIDRTRAPAGSRSIRYYYSRPRPAMNPGKGHGRSGARRGALGGDRVRDGQPRGQRRVRVDAGRPQGLRDLPGLLREFREDGKPERRGAAAVAGAERRQGCPGHAPGRRLQIRNRYDARPLSVP